MALKQENFHFTVSADFGEGLIRTMRVGLLFIVLMAGWLLMSGHYNGLLISLGVISVTFCVWLSHAISATDEEGLPTHIFARLPAYLFWLFGEIIKSNCATAIHHCPLAACVAACSAPSFTSLAQRHLYGTFCFEVDTVE